MQAVLCSSPCNSFCSISLLLLIFQTGPKWWETGQKCQIWPLSSFRDRFLMNAGDKDSNSYEDFTKTVNLCLRSAQCSHKTFLFTHSFSVTAYPLQGGLEPIPVDIGRGRGSPRTSCQFITGLTYSGKQPLTLTFTPTGNLESPVNLHVFGLWEEAGVPGENPGRHGENM